MATIVRRVNKTTGEVESFDSMLSRWKKLVKDEGIMQELQDRKYYMTRAERRKLKSKRAYIRDKKYLQNR